MLIERKQWVIGGIAALAIVAATIFAVIGTGSTALVRGTRVTAEFTDASGLENGDFLFVSGVRAGEVTNVERIPQSANPEMADAGPIVEAEFALRTDARIPADTRAEIILYSPLGRRGIALNPPDTSQAHLQEAGPLQAGDVITLDRTSTLTDLPEFGTETTDLLEELDVDALRSLTTSLADITEDQRQDVDRFLQGVQQLSEVLVDRRSQLSRALDRAEAFVDVAESRDDQVLEIIDDFQVTLDTLLDKQDEIERLLQETADTSTTAADFVSERRGQIDRVVADLSEALEVVDQHQVDLAHTLPYLATGLDGFRSIAYLNLAKQDTGQWGNVFTTGLGQVGIEALAGCGSPIDDVLTDLLGPDPTCPTGDVSGGSGGSTTATQPTAASSGDAPDPASSVLGPVFETGLQLDTLATDGEDAP